MVSSPCIERVPFLCLPACLAGKWAAGMQPLGDARLDPHGTMWYALCGRLSTCAIITDSCPLVKGGEIALAEAGTTHQHGLSLAVYVLENEAE